VRFPAGAFTPGGCTTFTGFWRSGDGSRIIGLRRIRVTSGGGGVRDGGGNRMNRPEVQAAWEAEEMKAFVTGASGFIGSHLCESLTAAGHEVMGFDRRGNAWNVPVAGWCTAELTDEKSLYNAVLGFRPELIFHLAGTSKIMQTVVNPLEGHHANLTGTLHLLEAARALQCKRVVFASSSAVYGEAVAGTAAKPEPVKEDHLCTPFSHYGVQNLAAEHYGHVYEKLYGIKFVALRMFNVYGPRQMTDGPFPNAVCAFVKNLLTGEKPDIYGDGEQTRDMLFVDDAVRAFLMTGLSDKPVRPDTLNIAGGEAISVNALLREVADILGVKADPSHEPARKGEARRMWADISNADKAVGWKPQFKLRDGLRKTVEWWRQHLARTKA